MSDPDLFDLIVKGCANCAADLFELTEVMPTSPRPPSTCYSAMSSKRRG